jgi:hypothetical protein
MVFTGELQLFFQRIKGDCSQDLGLCSTASIYLYYKRCKRTTEACSDGMTYGMEEFTERVYKGHSQVVDKSKW